MKDKKIYRVLIILLILGFVVRFFNIWGNPPSMYGDELTMVYDMYSILHTGFDQTGEFLPLTFSMGAGRPGGYIYSSLPFIALFGPTELGVRFLSLLSGVGMIALMFFLGKKLLNANTGLAAAFLTSISMWDISLSRGGFESHFALFLVTLGIVLSLYVKEKPWLIAISGFLWGLALHTYPTYKLILPLFLILLAWYFRSQNLLSRQLTRQIVVGLGIFMIFVMFAVGQFFISGSEKRFSQINIFSSSEIESQIISRVNFHRSLDNGPEVFNILVHNRVTEYTALLIEGYMSNFSPEYLFLHGDGNPRHNMASTGELYLVEILLIIIGAIGLLKIYPDKSRLIFGWLFIAPLATTLILVPHALRNLFMLPPLLLISSIGLISIWNNKILRFLVLALLIVQFSLFIHRLYFLAPYELNRFWSYPAKQASLFVSQEKGNYDYILVNTDIDNIEYAIPVYLEIDPQKVIDQNKIKTIFKEREFKKFDNIYIGSIPDAHVLDLIESIEGKVLYVGSFEKQSMVKDMNISLGIDNKPSFGWLVK